MPPTAPFFSPLLAQFNPYDEPAPPPAPPPPRPMSFSDLKQGLRDVNAGKVDNSTFRNGILALLVILALVVLILHFRQRHQNPAPPPDSLRKLGRELGHHIPFPLGSKLILKWVALSTSTPYPALLISSDLFDACVTRWAASPSFTVARNWGRARLQSLRPILFD
jgi:hypothetical protein